MIELKGKHNTAKVFTDLIDEAAISQLINLLNQEFCTGSTIRIMPDAHAGSGCTIGTTMTVHDKIVPSLVGVDIGCGMYCVKLNETEFNPQLLDNVIRQYIPFGHSIFETEDTSFKAFSELRCQSHVNISRALRSLGSLGGGNHFIEVDKSEDGCLYLVIHSGSRHLGLEVAGYYQNLAYRNLSNVSKDEVKTLINFYKTSGREREIEQALKTLNQTNRTSIPKDLCYLTDSDMDDYIHDMKIMNEFADANRKKIADVIINHMGWNVGESFTTIHNYVDTEHMILRKGSVSARKGEKLIIPINMRDGALICVGKGNEDWNQSAPHGAGRLLTRNQAKQSVSMEEYVESMNGIWTTSINKNTIDESPMAYKPMASIVDNIKDTVDIVSLVKPVYNFKAS